VSRLAQPSAAYAGDRGDPDPEVRALLAVAGRGKDDYLRAIAALCTARFLLPIVAVGDEGGDGPDPDRHAEMQALLLTTADGSTGLPVFTGLDALTAWKPEARPVPCRLDEVAATARQAGAVAVLVDVAGPSPLVIEDGLVAELAAARRLVELDSGAWGWLFSPPDSSPGGSAG
jgi:hypothetical protein